MAGFGSQGFGSTPYGIGTPATAPIPGGTILRDRATGKTLDARRIDTAKRDYVIDSYGRIEGMTSTRQLVILAIYTELGSSAMRELGLDLSQLDRVTANLQRRLESNITSAVKHLVDRQLIRVIGVTTFKAGPADGLTPGRVYGRFSYVDLSTGKPDVVEF